MGSPSRPRSGYSAGGHVAPSLAREIVGIVGIALAAMLMLSYFGFAGTVGSQAQSELVLLFGWLRWGIPVGLVFVSACCWLPNRVKLSWRRSIGVLMLLIGSAIGSDLFRPWSAGSLVHAPRLLLVSKSGLSGAWVVAGALLLIGLSLFVGTPIVRRGVQLFLAVLRRMQAALARGRLARAGAPPIAAVAPFEIEQDVGESAFQQRDITSLSVPTSGKTPRRKLTRRRGIFVPTFPLTLFDSTEIRAEAGDIGETQRRIAETFENFGIGVEMAEVSVGPTVTQYTLKPATGVKVSQIMALQNDLSLSLAAHPIRIEAPVPGRAVVGIEVPNRRVALVGLAELLGDPSFLSVASGNTGALLLALGKDVSGVPYVARLDRMPHMLIAGATGSGKTVAINAVLTALLYQNRPEQLRLLLIDPKRVELPAYNGIPHLIAPVITEVKKTIVALKWVLREMDRRFSLLAEAGRRDISSYNDQSEEPIPYLVVVIDELADLMVTAASDVEASIIRIAQMARAVGIHLIVATQRPSVDVLTGLIKANITTRLAFSVASSVDSRTILDTQGAEKLLGRGDALFMSAELSKPKRLQGAFVSEAETQRVVAALRTLGAPEYEDVSSSTVSVGFGEQQEEAETSEDEPLLDEAIAVIRLAGRASASLLQRRLKVGYARAARILDILEARGVIGPGEGAKPREVLLSDAASDIIESEPEVLPVDKRSEGSVLDMPNDNEQTNVTDS